MAIEAIVTHTAPSLDDALECFVVVPPNEHSKGASVNHWWAIGDDEGIIAYFATEVDACRYRLVLVNMACNPLL